MAELLVGAFASVLQEHSCVHHKILHNLGLRLVEALECAHDIPHERIRFPHFEPIERVDVNADLTVRHTHRVLVAVEWSDHSTATGAHHGALWLRLVRRIGRSVALPVGHCFPQQQRPMLVHDASHNRPSLELSAAGGMIHSEA